MTVTYRFSVITRAIIMWIRTQSTGTSRLYVAGLDAEIDFSANGTAQVAEEVGEQLLEQYDSIVVYEADEEASADDSDEDETEDADEPTED